MMMLHHMDEMLMSLCGDGMCMSDGTPCGEEMECGGEMGEDGGGTGCMTHACMGTWRGIHAHACQPGALHAHFGRIIARVHVLLHVGACIVYSRICCIIPIFRRAYLILVHCHRMFHAV